MNENRLKSKRQESSVAKEIDGKVTPASGALWGAKADVRNQTFLVECKITEKPFFVMTDALWEKIRSEAIKDGLRIPLMCIDLENGKQRFAVIDEADTNIVGILNMFEPIEFYGGINFDYSDPTRVKTHLGDVQKSHRLCHRGVMLLPNKKARKPVTLCVIPWKEFNEKIIPAIEGDKQYNV